MFEGILTVVHVLVSLVLIVIVLMQSQQSMNLSGMFGGASQSALGNRPESVLSKATTILAIVFMITSVVFAMWPSQQPGALQSGSRSPGGVPAQSQQTGGSSSGASSSGQQDQGGVPGSSQNPSSGQNNAQSSPSSSPGS